MDFDGVLTDNRVWTDQAGHESVAAFRGDSMGLNELRHRLGTQALVLSREANPVVSARCKKMNIPCIQSALDKGSTLPALLAEYHVSPAEVVYIGNDINDLPCFPLVGCAVVPADAEPAVLREADLVLTRTGGHGAVRELCDLILQNNQE